MKNRIFFAFFFTFFVTVVSAQQPKSSGYANVNGQKVYYEVYGEGKPIVLLHGAYMNIALNWGQIIPELSKTRQVIALEVQGHGHTPWSNRPLSYDALASDVDKTLQFLKIDSADVVGYSFGGTIAYNLAIKHPKRVKKLVIISSTYKYEGWQPEVRNVLQTMQPEFLADFKGEYVKFAPDSTQWIPFLKGMIDFDKKDFNLGDNNIKNIKSPTLLILGDNDGIDKSIAIQTYKMLGGTVFADMAGVPPSQLAIIPGQGHVTVMMSEMILKLVSSFL